MLSGVAVGSNQLQDPVHDNAALTRSERCRRDLTRQALGVRKAIVPGSERTPRGRWQRPVWMDVRRLSNPRALIWRDGPALFAFLVDAGFAGPERTRDGIVYRRRALRVEVCFVGPREPAVVTFLSQMATDGTGIRAFASLDCLYVACGLGPLQDVPGTAPNLAVMGKRLQQHAQALRLVLPHLLGERVESLFRRCQQRLLPDP